jgi:uncharacterized protein YutE (UPF0331/DUF86 family)
MIDRTLVTRKINLIVTDLVELTSFGEMTLETYLAQRLHSAAAERYLELIIGRMIDINFHIITELGYPPPKDYFESFVSLGAHRVLPRDFARRIASAAGLRNRIVHEYDVIDQRMIHQAIQQALRDIPRYLDHVNDFLTTSTTAE